MRSSAAREIMRLNMISAFSMGLEKALFSCRNRWVSVQERDLRGGMESLRAFLFCWVPLLPCRKRLRGQDTGDAIKQRSKVYGRKQIWYWY